MSEEKRHRNRGDPRYHVVYETHPYLYLGLKFSIAISKHSILNRHNYWPFSHFPYDSCT